MARVKSGTLTANAVATVAVDDAYPAGLDVEVVNRTQSGTIWVTFDGSTPTVAGDDCHPVLGARRFQTGEVSRSTITVKLISTAALDYTVESTTKW